MTEHEWQEIVDEMKLKVASAGEGVVQIYSPDTDRYYALTPGGVGNITAEECRELFTGKREPDELFTFTRIVGYYSATANWNRGKLGELEDRRKGNYAAFPKEGRKEK